MDATERRLVMLLATRAAVMSGTVHAPYRIYPRKTRRTGRGGRAISIYYYQQWDGELRRYETARSTGQTSRAAAETWAAVQLATAAESQESIAGFARGWILEFHFQSTKVT